MSMSLTCWSLGQQLFQPVQRTLPWCLEEPPHFSLMNLPKFTVSRVTTTWKLSGSSPKDAPLHELVTAHLYFLKSTGAYLQYLITMLLLWDRKRERSISCLLAITKNPNEWAETWSECLRRTQGFPLLTWKENQIINICSEGQIRIPYWFSSSFFCRTIQCLKWERHLRWL